MRKTLFFIIILLNWLQFISVKAQTGTLFSTDKELSSSLVNDIYQDKRNYIWIATEDGLNKYDAVKFTTYRNDKNDSTTLTNNYVHTLLEDSMGRFWIACLKGLLLYDRKTDSFSDVDIYDNGVKLTPDVTAVTETSDGEVWIGIWGVGVVRVRETKKHYDIDHFVSDRLKSKYLVNIFEDTSKNIWILTSDQGLTMFSPSSRKFKYYFAPDKIGSNQTSTMCQDDKGKLFVGTLTSGLFIYDSAKDCFTSVKSADLTVNSSALPIKSLFRDSHNQILVGTDGYGLKHYNTSTNLLENFRNESSHYELRKLKVHSIKEDRQGNLWIGLFQKGVYFIPNNPNKFTTWGYKSHVNNVIGSSCVMSVMVDKDNTMWVGTDNDGLYAVAANGNVRHYEPGNSENSVSGTIMAVYEDSNGDIWLGSYLKGISKFNKKTGLCTYFNKIPESLGDNFLSNKVFCLTEDKKNKTLWIGTNGAGVYSFDLNTLSFKSHFTHNPKNKNSIINNGINDIMVDRDGYVWVGTFRGISKINPLNGTVENLTENNSNIPGSIIYSILEDKSHNIWIGTDEGLGLISFDGKNSRNFTTNDGLSSNVICGILEDNDKNIWISTHSGISKLDTRDCKFFNYYASDGLQGNEFSRGTRFMSRNGEMFFGGTNGVTGFFPKQINTNRQKLEVCLTELSILGKPVKTGQKSGTHRIIDNFISDAKTIRLNFSDNMFSMEFSTFNFGNSERIFYRYKLEGLNSQWINTGLGTNRISFTNLGYGKYKLRVVACENDNTSAEKVFDIIIFPPWYLTDLAKFIYVLLFIGLVYIVLRIVNERIQSRHELIRREQMEQVNEGKLQFFINISHEIRTPMTLILSPLEKLMQDTSNAERTQAYQLMHRNAQRILRLINQLLDLRKIDKKLMFVKMCETDIVSFVQDIVKTFEYQSGKKHVTLTFEHEMPVLNAWIDVNNFDKVLVNILSNAFKFTPDEAEITIKLSTGKNVHADNDLKEYFEIVVSDNGIGIQEDKIEKIFERFYQIDSGNTSVNFGTGIGLHLSKNLIELMHGTINARNRTDSNGSEFIIRLPLGRNHLLDTEIELVDDKQVHIATPVYEYISDAGETVSNVKPKTKFKILIVDDEVEIRHYLKQNLVGTYKVAESDNGKSALEMLLKEKFDLVISDVMMPVMDGITLCKRIKSNVNIKNVPVVLLTAKSSDDDKAEGYETGADAYVSKPFNIDLLKKRIAGIISNRERLDTKIAEKSDNKALIKQVELKSADQLLLEKIIKHINENIGNPDFNVQILADKVGMSRVHLHRKMKELTNQSAADYIKTIRLQQAGVLLKSKKLSVSEVCYALGFINQNHFSGLFREFYGMSPKDFVKYENIEKE